MDKKNKKADVEKTEKAKVTKTDKQREAELEKYYENYYKELNEFAKQNSYKDMYDMRDKLLDRVTDYFVSISDHNETTDEEKLRFSIKSVLTQLQTDSIKAADVGSYDPIFANLITERMYPSSLPSDRNQVRDLLRNPEANANKLREIAEYVRNNILQYERAEEYFISLFSFKYYLLPKRPPKEMSDFAKSKKKAYNLLQGMRIKEQYPRILADVIKNGVGFYMFKKGSDFLDFIRIPIDMCRVTNVRTSFGICFEIDVYYFEYLTMTHQLSPEIYDYYKDLIKEKRAPLEKGDTRSAKSRLYIPISPLHGFCFVADSYKPTAVPLLAGLLPDALDILEYKNLAKQKAILETWCIIPQVIPYDEAEKPRVPLMLAKQTIQSLQGMLPPGVVTFSTPLEPQDPITLQNASNQNNIVSLGEQNFFSSVGIAGNVMGVGEAKNSAVIDFSNLVDFGFVNHIYNQFSMCTNLLLMMFVNDKDWKVQFFGNFYRDEREIKEAQAVFTGTNMPAEYLGANLGFEPQDFENMLLMGETSKLKEKMLPIASAFNTSGQAILSGEEKNEGQANSNVSGEVGRPKADESDLSDSGEQNRENETNGNKEGL